MHDLLKAVAEITGPALAGYELAERYYEGRKWEVWTRADLATKYKGEAEMFKVNITRRPITAVLNRLEITSVAVEDSGDTSDPEAPDENTVSPLQAKLDDIWRANELDLELPAAFEKALEFGDAYVFVWDDPDDETSAEVTIKDPKGTRAFYDPENNRRVQFIGSTWISATGYRRVNLYYRDRVERWVSINKEEDGIKPDSMDEYTHFYAADPDEPDYEDSWFESHDYGRPPVFHLRTERPYGRPKHQDVYGAQNILTKQIATMTAATEDYGLPFRFTTTKPGTTGQGPNVDDDWGQPDSASDRPHAPRGKQVKGTAGSFAEFENTDQVGQLQPADIANFLEPIDLTMRLASTVSDTPLSYFDPAANVSGVSRREEALPLVKAVEHYQRAFGGEISRALQLALKIATGVDTTVRITWAEAQLVDEKEQWEIVAAKTSAGMPLRQALIEAGYVDKAVDVFLEKSGEQAYSQRVETVLKVAQIAREFGTAQTLGTVSEEQVQELVSALLGGDPDEDGDRGDPAS